MGFHLGHRQVDLRNDKTAAFATFSKAKKGGEAEVGELKGGKTIK